MPKKPLNLYEAIIENIFFHHYLQNNTQSFEFTREEVEKTAKELGIMLPKNIGDVIYSFRYRKNLPESIISTAKAGYEWIIKGAGRSTYNFCQAKVNRILPNGTLVTIKIPDSTPEIIAAHAKISDKLR